MARIEESIEVAAPVATVYNQWTQFEQFPRFMEGVERVVQLDESTLQWTAQVAGREKSWQARIVEQVPDVAIAWVATEGARNDGRVSFERLSASRTRIDLALDVEPESPVEKMGTAFGVMGSRVKGDMERFRDFIESRGVETGAWRGEVREDAIPAGRRPSDPSTSPGARARDAAYGAGEARGRVGDGPSPSGGYGAGYGIETEGDVPAPTRSDPGGGTRFGTETDFGAGAPDTVDTTLGTGFGTETDFGAGTPGTVDTTLGTGFGTETDRGPAGRGERVVAGDRDRDRARDLPDDPDISGPW